MKVLFIARGPSPYRVSFFNELGKKCELTVVFELRPDEINDRDKTWGRREFLYFKGIYLKKTLKIRDDNLCIDIINYLDENKFDRIIIGMYSTPTQILAIAYMKMRHISYALSSDGGFIKNESNIQRKVKRFLIKGAYKYFASSGGTADYLKNYGADKDKIIIYPFTTKLESQLPSHILNRNEKIELRRELNLPIEKKIIISVGQFIYRKGFDIVIKAAAKLDSSYFFLLIGGTETIEYEKICNECNINNIVFLDFMDQNVLSDYYNASDAFVLATREDIWGLVINEAMSHGLPVVTTTKCLAGVELIINNENGFIVNVNNVDETANAIHNLFMDEVKLEKMRNNNYLKMVTQYTIEKMALAYYNAMIHD